MMINSELLGTMLLLIQPSIGFCKEWKDFRYTAFSLRILRFTGESRLAMVFMRGNNSGRPIAPAPLLGIIKMRILVLGGSTPGGGVIRKANCMICTKVS
jgi:hypothetical protein